MAEVFCNNAFFCASNGDFRLSIFVPIASNFMVAESNFSPTFENVLLTPSNFVVKVPMAEVWVFSTEANALRF